MATLLENYKNRIKIAEAVYSKNHGGAGLDNHRKLVLAKVLDNTSKFLNEAFDSTNATQRSDMGLWKKFCLNLTNVALPNLIANDLVIVSPMSSMSGYITYIEYLAGNTKGNTQNGDLFNNPFMLGDVDGTAPDGTGRGYSANYTSDRVVESFATSQTTLGWAPAMQGAFDVRNSEGQVTLALGDVKVVRGSTVKYGTFASAASAQTGTLASMTFKNPDGTADTDSFALTAGDKIYYVYNNIVIPQADLPMLKAEMKSIPLIAKARRIAVYYSQIAAFQAKTDYGFDLGDQLAEKAVGQLSYEIDTEITNLLADNAANYTGSAYVTTDGTSQASTSSDLLWSKTLPVGVSKSEHYEGFSEVVEIARAKIYNATKRFAPNYMLISADVLPVLTFIKGFSAAPAGTVNGPYFAGTLNSLKVFVTPNIGSGYFVIGVNGNDMMSSAAVYAPYMAIVPTQLLQYADGGTSQGFSTLYDLKMLNKNLVVKGQVVA